MDQKRTEVRMGIWFATVDLVSHWFSRSFLSLSSLGMDQKRTRIWRNQLTPKATVTTKDGSQTGFPVKLTLPPPHPTRQAKSDADSAGSIVRQHEPGACG